VVSTPRYEEVAQQRAELEDVKRENERLKQRIRDLERMIRSGDEGGQRGRIGAPEGGVALPEGSGASWRGECESEDSGGWMDGDMDGIVLWGWKHFMMNEPWLMAAKGNGV
jgi:hypothetical protein